jgi:hypothetical protein
MSAAPAVTRPVPVWIQYVFRGVWSVTKTVYSYCSLSKTASYRYRVHGQGRVVGYDYDIFLSVYSLYEHVCHKTWSLSVVRR